MGKIMHQGVNYSSINDAEHLSNLQDTQISNPADGNILQYDGNTNKWKNAVAQEHTTFNGRSGSILPMAGDYDDSKVILSSTMHIDGEDQTTVKEALEALEARPSSTFNGRSGSILPMAGDYTANQVIFSSIMHIGGETQFNVEDGVNALNDTKIECVTIATEEEWNQMTEAEKNDPSKLYFLPWDTSGSGGGGSAPTADQVMLSSVIEIGGRQVDNVEDALISLNNPFKIVTWADGTDEEIAAMLEAHYNGDIDITDYWTVGDERVVHLNAMAETGIGESHRAQDVTMVILDFNHDNLTAPINGITKAAITIQQKDCLRDTNVTDTTGSSNTENGYINSSNTNVGGWTSCARRTWCNSVYYNALPSNFKNMVKQVNKLTSAGNQSSTINTDADYCWLPSEIEVFGTNSKSISGEGTQYSYYTTTANICKLPKWSSSYVSDCWWERSPCGSSATYFCSVNAGGSASHGSANSAIGLAPACCL